MVIVSSVKFILELFGRPHSKYLDDSTCCLGFPIVTIIECPFGENMGKPISYILLPILTLCRFVQFSNAWFPMELTFGNEIDNRLVHFTNAPYLTFYAF